MSRPFIPAIFSGILPVLCAYSDIKSQCAISTTCAEVASSHHQPHRRLMASMKVVDAASPQYSFWENGLFLFCSSETMHIYGHCFLKHPHPWGMRAGSFELPSATQAL
jgi:hypothetical protein